MNKKNWLCLGLFFVAFFSVFAENTVESKFYAITYADGTAEVKDLSSVLDDYYSFFNGVFHFSKTGPGFKQLVRVFSSESDYQNYVKEKTQKDSAPKSAATFLRYSEKKDGEFAMVASSMLTADFTRQLFIQYIYGFVDNVQPWILAGFPLYFENTEWASGKGVLEKAVANPWLGTAKELSNKSSSRLSVKAMLEAKADSYPLEDFMPQCYMLVQFLLHAPDTECNRLFFDGLSMLKHEHEGDTFLKYRDEWLSDDRIESGYRDYIVSLKGFIEHMNEGIAHYTKNETDDAIVSFRAALALEKSSSIAMYYYGLSLQKQKRYAEADAWYKKALDADNGAIAAYIYWGLGTTAVSDSRNEEAIGYLNNAKEEDSERFGTRVNDLLAKIQ